MTGITRKILEQKRVQLRKELDLRYKKKKSLPGIITRKGVELVVIELMIDLSNEISNHLKGGSK